MLTLTVISLLVRNVLITPRCGQCLTFAIAFGIGNILAARCTRTSRRAGCSSVANLCAGGDAVRLDADPRIPYF